MHKHFLATVLCGVSWCASAAPPAGHQAGDEAAVLAAVDRFMEAVTSQDTVAMAAILLPDGTTYRSMTLPDGSIELRVRPNAYWLDPANKDPRSHRERYWSPTVHIRGGIAQVWAPYEFWIDGKTSHCGIDTFDLVKIDGNWRIANGMWTVEPDACAGLRPASPAAIRPRDAK